MKFIDRLLARHNMSLLTLISIGFLALFLVGFLTYFVVVDRQARQGFEDAQASALKGVNEAITNQIYRSLQREVAGIQSRAQILTQTQVYRQKLEAEQNWIDASTSYMDDVSWMGFANTKGIVEFANKGMLAGADVSQRPWFQGAMVKPVFVGDVHAAVLLAKFFDTSSAPDQIRFIDIAVPIHNPAGEIVGVLGSHIHWTAFGKKLEQFAKEFAMHTHMGFAIMGPDGVRLAEAEVAGSLVTPELKTAFQQGHSQATVQINGVPNLVSYTKLPGEYLSWVVVNYEPISPGALYHDISKSILVGGLIVLLLGLIPLFWLYVWARKTVSEALNDSEHADVSTDVSTDVWLATEFRRQADKIHSLKQQVRSQADQLEEATQLLEASFKGFSEKFPGYLLRLSAPIDAPSQLRVDYVSSSVERFLGVSAEAFKADMSVCHAYVSSEDLAESFRVFAISAKTLEPASVNLRACHPGGSYWMHLSAAVRVEEDRLVWDSLVLDITELKQAEAVARKASEEKSLFLATLSHEIRTPLNAVLGYAQLLEHDRTVPESIKVQIRVIKSASQTLATILGDVLDASSLDMNKLQLNQVGFDLTQLLDSLSAIYEPMAVAKQLNFVANVPQQISAVMGDPVRIKQIISNLLSNAIKYSDQGGVTLSCEATPVDGKLHIKLGVRDTGIGISSEDQQSMFTSFYQAQGKDGVRRAGSGLGLYIARSLAEKMGGSLSIASDVGQGSLFTLNLVLPLCETNEEPSGEQPGAVIRPLRVLVVDDAAMNRVILKTYLNRKGHQVSEAADGAEAVAIAQAEKPDVIFMDIEMPGMDGITATQRIRQSGLDQSQLCIIAMTGQAFEKDVAAGKAAGMNDYLTKPVDFKKVDETLKRHLT